MSTVNIAHRFEHQVNKHPEKEALILSKKSWFSLRYRYHTLSFSQIQERIEAIAHELRERGARPQDRAVVFIKPGEHLAAVTFALFRIGVVPVFIDPGMGKENLLRCIEQAKPRLLIAETVVHLIKMFYPKAFRSVEIALSPRGLHRCYKKTLKPELTYCEKTQGSELAAILFTSGGTGAPKGVQYNHQLFDTQTTLLKEMFNLDENERDCPGFPLFSLFTLCMGMSSVIPDLNAAQPSKAKPERLVRQILDQQTTFLAGSPAIWEKVALYCLKNNITLPSVKWVVMFGAPVSLKIHRSFKAVLPNGNTYTPYGATEALPISLIDGQTILENHVQDMERGRGWAIGKPVQGAKVCLIPITDEPLASLEQAPPLGPNEIGEIIVQGEMVTRAYDSLPEANKVSKIDDPQTGFWHRMGDIGFMDEQGQLWFCGRKTHRVPTNEGLLSSIQCEAIFNTHPDVRRSALVGLPNGGQTFEPAIIIELNQSARSKREQRVALKAELAQRAMKYPHTQHIKKIYFSESFPVDVRHHIKIDRLKLRDMAVEGRLQ